MKTSSSSRVIKSDDGNPCSGGNRRNRFRKAIVRVRGSVSEMQKVATRNEKFPGESRGLTSRLSAISGRLSQRFLDRKHRDDLKSKDHPCDHSARPRIFTLPATPPSDASGRRDLLPSPEAEPSTVRISYTLLNTMHRLLFLAVRHCR